MNSTVFVEFLDCDDDGFTESFLKEARKQKLTIRTVEAFRKQHPELTEQWVSTEGAVSKQLMDYVKESICFVWIFSHGYLQHQKSKKYNRGDVTQSILDVVYDHFVVRGDDNYSSARMFTICHKTTREQLREIDCIMASYAPLDSSCGPVIAAQLLEIKVKGQTNFAHSIEVYSNSEGAVVTGLYMPILQVPKPETKT